jgi:hypothetical protein
MKQNIGEIVKRYADQIKDSKIFLNPNIPHKKLKKALDSYAKGIKEEDVLVLIDNTFFGSAKDGAILTPTTFYAYNFRKKSQFIELNEIKTMYLEEGPKGCRLHLNGLTFLETNLLKRESVRKVTEMLREISECIHPIEREDKAEKRIEKLDDKDRTVQENEAKALGKTKDKSAKSPQVGPKYDERVNAWNVTVQEGLSSEALADFYPPGFSRMIEKLGSKEAVLRKLWLDIPKEIVVYPPRVPKEQYRQGKAIFSAKFKSGRTGEYLSGTRGYRFSFSIKLHGEDPLPIFEKVFTGETPEMLQGSETHVNTASHLLWNQISNFNWILPKACRLVLNDFSVLLETRGGKKDKLANFLSSVSFSSEAPEMNAAICALKGDWEGCARLGVDSARILTLCLGTDDHKKCSRHLVAMGPDIISYIQDMIPYISGDGLERAKIVIKRIEHIQ